MCDFCNLQARMVKAAKKGKPIPVSMNFKIIFSVEPEKGDESAYFFKADSELDCKDIPTPVAICYALHAVSNMIADEFKGDLSHFIALFCETIGVDSKELVERISVINLNAEKALKILSTREMIRSMR